MFLRVILLLSALVKYLELIETSGCVKFSEMYPCTDQSRLQEPRQVTGLTDYLVTMACAKGCQEKWAELKIRVTLTVLKQSLRNMKESSVEPRP